jgi:hypothetical protein
MSKPLTDKDYLKNTNIEKLLDKEGIEILYLLNKSMFILLSNG